MTSVGTRSPATGRGAATRRGPGWDAVVSLGVVLGFFAGLWLLMAPFALGYQTAVGDFDPRWHGVLAGFAVAVCSLVHAMAPRETPWLGPVLLLVGAWLVVAPFAGRSPELGIAAVNEAVTGAVVVVAGVGASARAAVRRWGAG
ncbi:SPW repeat domain-containing protein [Saccharothrix lopnurensis]|uniref:SPW repeat-containing integral membrane domain-containing protein n=1 Tax=Saccharothrix lopnurensis TaxID=1670621 RepID=A0ABW1NWC0_9PSEU